jgi:hypothetical protein
VFTCKVVSMLGSSSVCSGSFQMSGSSSFISTLGTFVTSVSSEIGGSYT